MIPESREVFFNINISEHDFIAYYKGVVKNIIVRSEDGRTIQFPAHLLQKFTSHSGVKGRFKINYGADNRLVAITRVDIKL